MCECCDGRRRYTDFAKTHQIAMPSACRRHGRSNRIAHNGCRLAQLQADQTEPKRIQINREPSKRPTDACALSCLPCPSSLSAYMATEPQRVQARRPLPQACRASITARQALPWCKPSHAASSMQIRARPTAASRGLREGSLSSRHDRRTAAEGSSATGCRPPHSRGAQACDLSTSKYACRQPFTGATAQSLTDVTP